MDFNTAFTLNVEVRVFFRFALFCTCNWTATRDDLKGGVSVQCYCTCSVLCCNRGVLFIWFYIMCIVGIFCDYFDYYTQKIPQKIQHCGFGTLSRCSNAVNNCVSIKENAQLSIFHTVDVKNKSQCCSCCFMFPSRSLGCDGWLLVSATGHPQHFPKLCAFSKCEVQLQTEL